MDYTQIDSIMFSRSLITNPAFDDLYISIETMPNLNGCPLGLYYPNRSLVVLPPDATEGALFHELGHRHGHYYYNDLSERYAENFRRKYQKGMVLLYMGSNFGNLSKLGVLFEEGERGVVEIALAQRPTLDELHNIKSQFYSYGEAVPKFFYGNSENPWVRIEFTKGVDWLVIVGSILVGATLAGVGALGYAIYKTAETTPWVVPVTLVGIGAALLLRAAAKQAVVAGV